MSRSDRLGAGALINVIVMERESNRWIDRLGPTEQMLEHHRVGIIPHHARELHYDWRTCLGRASKQPVNLLQIANIECFDSVVSVCSLEEIVGGDAHEA